VNLQETVREFPLETRQRWYAEMNCWKSPADFPVPLPKYNEGVAEGAPYGRHTNPAWNEAWNAVQSSLTEPEQSLGWWLFELGKTEHEWRAWWEATYRRTAK